MRVLVIQENTSFRAPNGAPELQHSVEYSFPTSVLASLPIEAERDGTVLVDADCLLMRDAFDLLSQLRRPTRAVGGAMVREQSSKAADWRLDKDRSVIDLEHSGSFPLNTEVEALLTFATDSESDLNQPDPHALERARASFVCGHAGSGIRGAGAGSARGIYQRQLSGFFPALRPAAHALPGATAGACRKKIRMLRSVSQ